MVIYKVIGFFKWVISISLIFFFFFEFEKNLKNLENPLLFIISSWITPKLSFEKVAIKTIIITQKFNDYSN